MALLQGACGAHSKTASAPDAGRNTPSRPNTTVISHGTGGSAVTRLGYGISVNPKSSLEREWITAQDTLLPARLDGTIGVRTVYSAGSSYSSGEYHYLATVPVIVTDAISALEVRFVLFDIWGDFVKTLSETEIEDIPAGAKRTFSPRWRVWDENEVSEHYASLAYVARVRTKSGQVFEANDDPIVAEARKISERFAPEDLDPNNRPHADSTTAKR
jgi:hypothetical protein